LQFAPANAATKNCKRVCLYQRCQTDEESQLVTMYIANRAFRALLRFGTFNIVRQAKIYNIEKKINIKMFSLAKCKIESSVLSIALLSIY
jgi:hypothetical protein